MEVPASIIWSAASGLLAAGVAYGGLAMKARGNAARIEAVKVEHDADIAGIRATLQGLAAAQSAHRVETTDRLGRIEEKLDQLLRSSRHGQ
jgi:DNA-binding GntR family transcriptional regulator